MRCVTLLWLRILEIPKARFKKCGLLFSNCNSVFARVEIKSGNVFLLLSSLFISSFNLHFPKKLFQNLEAHSRVSRILLEWTCSIVHIYVLESLFGRQAHKRHDVLCGKYYLITSRVRKQHGTSTELSRVPPNKMQVGLIFVNSTSGHYHCWQFSDISKGRVLFISFWTNAIVTDCSCFSGERCLDHDTNMMALRKVNPHADWIVKPQTRYLHL